MATEGRKKQQVLIIRDKLYLHTHTHTQDKKKQSNTDKDLFRRRRKIFVCMERSSL